MGAEIGNGAAAVLVMVYLIVFGMGTTFLVIGFAGSLWRAVSEREKYWQHLRTVILFAAWFFGVTYGIIVLLWLNRAAFPEVLAYAAACAFAFYVIRKIGRAEAPKSAGALGSAGAIVAACIAAYAWGLNSGISRGWAESGYFVAYGKCDSSFDHCIESGPYATFVDCRQELVSIDGTEDTNQCIRLQDVPRVYLPWTR